jgi:subtilisin family serine protease
VAAAAALALTTFTSVTASADSTELAPLLINSNQPIAGSYIVVLDQNATSSRIDAVAGAATAAGASVRYVYRTAIKGFSAKMSDSALAKIRATAGVAYVEADAGARLDDTVSQDKGQQPALSWGIDRADQRNRPMDGTYHWKHTGKGVTAYVIDTGIRISHTQFEGRASYGYDFYDDDEIASDCHGHGTHVAGTVGGKDYGIAKEVSLVAMRTIDCGGFGVVGDSIAAVDWVVEHATTRAVMNMSLHFGKVQALNDAIHRAYDADILFAAAAANDNQDACNDSPSSEPTAVTVAASTETDQEAGFSNHGPCVDLYAPGTNIVSAGLSSDTATAVMSGTSMASPHVCGALALVLEKKPAANAKKITKALLKKTSKDKISNPGPGTPNKLLFTKKF